MASSTLFAATVCLVIAADTSAAAGGAVSEPFDPERIAWRELRFGAHKAGISATVHVRLDAAPAGSVAPAASLAEGGGAPVRPVAGEVWLESTTRLPGRTFLARELVDASRATVLKIVDTETGARHHRKTYTLEPRGFALELVEPASLSEMFLPPERWTRLIRTFTAYPADLQSMSRITGPAGLLYAASAANLTSPGDEMTINVLVQTQVERVTVRVEGVQSVQLDYQETSGGATGNVKEESNALRLVVQSEPVGEASSSVFRIFGLGGDVELLWDPVRRLPVELSGQVRLLGRVQVRLTAATLR